MGLDSGRTVAADRLRLDQVSDIAGRRIHPVFDFVGCPDILGEDIHETRCFGAFVKGVRQFVSQDHDPDPHMGAVDNQDHDDADQDGSKF